jgi:hypothetical protein
VCRERERMVTQDNQPPQHRSNFVNLCVYAHHPSILLRERERVGPCVCAMLYIYPECVGVCVDELYWRNTLERERERERERLRDWEDDWLVLCCWRWSHGCCVCQSWMCVCVMSWWWWWMDNIIINHNNTGVIFGHDILSLLVCIYIYIYSYVCVYHLFVCMNVWMCAYAYVCVC